MSWACRFFVCGLFLSSSMSVLLASEESWANNGRGCPVKDGDKKNCAGGNGACVKTCTQKILGCSCI